MLTKAGIGASDSGDLDPEVKLSISGDVATLALAGLWNTNRAGRIDNEMRELEQRIDTNRVIVNLSGVRAMDTAGAWIVQRFIVALENRNVVCEVTGANQAAQTLLHAVSDAARIPEPESEGFRLSLRPVFEKLGRSTVAMWDDFIMAMDILGATVRGAQLKLGRGHGLSPAAIVSQIDRMGVGAIPVIVLMSTIIGAIIAQQGAFQLRYFGAELFVVDLVGILVLREIGVLLTAIMVAGRSGSAITAEVGSMKMREEIDALKVIGLNPVGVLVFPRLVALVIALPLLTIIADFAALFGAMMVAWVYSSIPPEVFIERLHFAIDLSTYYAGLIKAPFMALIIGIVASVEGMKVGGSAESLGRHVTASVVKAIFVVIVVDGLFAMFYAAIDF